MADLTVTLTESVTLNGSARGSTNTLTISGVDDIFHRIITVPAGTSNLTLVSFTNEMTDRDGALDRDLVKYIRVTNLDASNPVNLSLQVSVDEDGAADASATLFVDAGRSFIMGATHDGIVVDDDAAAIVTSLTDLESILIDPGSNAVSVEVFIAS